MCEIKVKDYDEHDLKQNEEKKNPNYFSDYEIQYHKLQETLTETSDV